MKTNRLNEGDLCEVTYKSQSGNNRWYRWDCVAVFLYDDGSMSHWSLRPKAGTMTIPTDHLGPIKVLMTAKARMGKRDSDATKLPKRRKGAVSAPWIKED